MNTGKFSEGISSFSELVEGLEFSRTFRSDTLGHEPALTYNFQVIISRSSLSATFHPLPSFRRRKTEPPNPIGNFSERSSENELHVRSLVS